MFVLMLVILCAINVFLTVEAVFNGNTHTIRHGNALWFDQIINLVNEPHKNNPKKHFGFLTVYAMPSAGSSGKDFFVPVHLKASLLLWNANLGTVWSLPAGSRVETSSLYVDMFTGPAEVAIKGQGRPEAMKRVYGAMKGNWTRTGVDFAPYRAAIIGRGATAESENYVYEIVRVLSSNAMGIIGFQASSHWFRTNFEENYLFARVDDSEYAVHESIILFLKSVGITNALVWGCDTTADYDAFNIALKPIAAKNGITVKIGLMVGLRQDHFKPELNDMYSWVDALKATWNPLVQYHITLFSDSSPANCPMFDFMSFAYPWIIGQQMFWVGGSLETKMVQYTTSYLPTGVKLDSPYIHTNPFDGMYSLTKDWTYPLFGQYKSWFTNTLVANPDQLEWYMRFALGLIGDIPTDVAYMLDASWGIMLVGNSLIAKHGVNYTSKNMHDEIVGFEFEGLTGKVSMPNRDRISTWKVQVYKRPSATCAQPRFKCASRLLLNLDQLDDSNLFSGITKCLQGDYDWSSAPPTLTDHGTIRGSQLSAPLAYYFGCSSAKPDVATLFGCFPGFHYNPGSGSCEPCESGSFMFAFGLQKNLACAKCPIGSNRSRLGASYCRTCLPGTYASEPGTAFCKSCPPGSHTDIEWGEHHVAQGAGINFFEGGPRQCTLCGQGTYTDTHGWAYCKVCPKGKFQSGVGHTACSTCPGDRTTPVEGALSESSCVCGSGTFLPPGSSSSSSCLSCSDVYPKNAVGSCPGAGTLPTISPKYMTLVDSTIMYSCQNYELACPGGKHVTENTCVGVATGIACAWCGDDFLWSIKDGLCSECEDFPMVLIVSLASLITILFIVRLRPFEVDVTEVTILAEVSINFVCVPVFQLFDFFQVQAIFGRSQIPWPKSIKRLFSGWAALFDLSALHLPCLYGHGDIDSDARDHLLVLNMIPAAFMLLLFLATIPAVCSQRARALRMPSPIRAVGISLGVISTLFTALVSLSTVLVFSTYKHPKAKGLDGEPLESLIAFPYILTNSDAKNSLDVIGYASLGVWGLGFILCVMGFVWTLTITDNPTFHRLLLPITTKYRRHRVWWIGFDLLAKVFASLSLALFDEASKQMQVLMGVYIVYGLALYRVAPYRFLRHNQTDAVFTLGKILILSMAVPYIAPDLAQAPEAAGPIWYTLIVIYVNFVIAFLSSLIMFWRGYASDPKFDTFIILALKDLLQKALPTQRPIEELIPDLASEAYQPVEKKEETFDDLNAKGGDKAQEHHLHFTHQHDGLQTAAQLQYEEYLWKIGIQRKNELIDQDCKYILDKIIPTKLKASFQSLIASQKAMVAHFQNRDKSNVQTQMDEQTNLLKELLS